MKYTEVIIELPESEIDACCEKLTELGCSGFIIENESDFNAFLENNRQYWDYVDEELTDKFKGLSRVKLYLEEGTEGDELLRAISGQYSVSTSTVSDSDWENNWRQYYKPLEIGEKLLVVPQWEEAEAAQRVKLVLDPGLMFGTGSHATTRMCLKALEKLDLSGKTVLDLGCGSGILGIGALVLGCESAVGVDIDPKAPDVVMENAALNGIGGDRLKVYAGDIIGDTSLRKMLGGGYAAVLANIVSDVIIPLAPHVRQFMSEDGVFIASGIIDGREDEVIAAIENAGFTVTEHLHEEEWHCCVCR